MTRVAFFSVVLAVVSGACAPRYAPSESRPVALGDFTAVADDVVTVPRQQGLIVGVRLDAQRPVTLAGVWFGSDATRCGEGHRPRRVVLDGAVVESTRPVELRGSHRLEAHSRLLDPQTLLDHAYVDLQVGEGSRFRCLRVRVTSEEHPLRIARRPMIFVRGELSGSFGASAGVTGNLGGDAGVGLWLSRVRLSAGVGARAVGCDDSRCPEVVEDGGRRNRRAPAIVGSLSAATLPLVVGPHAFGLGLEYLATGAFLETYEGDRTQWVHTPRILIHWSSGHAGVRGLSDGGSPAAFEVSIPVGLQMAKQAGTVDTAVTIGFLFGGMNML